MQDWLRTYGRGLKFFGGLALLYIASSRAAEVVELMGWRYAAAPILLLSGGALLLEAFVIRRGSDVARLRELAPARKVADHELALLGAARAQGMLTVELAALATGLPISESQSLLQRLEREGHLSSEVDDLGCQWYGFPGLPGPGRASDLGGPAAGTGLERETRPR